MNVSNVNGEPNRKPSDERISCVALSPNGRYYGCMTWRGKVLAWDVESHTEIAQFKVDRGKYYEEYALGISSDGSHVVASVYDRVTVWSKGEIIWLKECKIGAEEILMPHSTECGHFVTSYPNYVWEMATGDCYKHKSHWAKAVSPDGHY